jgi:putative endonuclease
MNHRCYYVYILTNLNKTVLYTGITNDLQQRLAEHYFQRGQTKSFCGRYHTYYLLYYEPFQYIKNAIRREKEIKGWTRDKKMELINKENPSLEFLNYKFCRVWPPAEFESRSKGKS